MTPNLEAVSSQMGVFFWSYAKFMEVENLAAKIKALKLAIIFAIAKFPQFSRFPCKRPIEKFSVSIQNETEQIFLSLSSAIAIESPSPDLS